MTNLAGKPPLGLKADRPVNGTASGRRHMGRVKLKAGGFPLRENARGQNCTLRLPGCRSDTAYTVFAHFRRFGWAGMGQKPMDILGCFSCDKCHALQEAHDPSCTYEDMLRAMGETLMIQVHSGILRFGNEAGMD